MYPHKADADAHTTYCTVSRTIADLLERSPSLTSIAVNTFCLPAAAGSNKNYIAVMKKFGKFLSVSLLCKLFDFSLGVTKITRGSSDQLSNLPFCRI